MKILVSGGTGFIGSHIVRQVLSLYPGASVRILSRRAATANLWGERVEYHQGNITNPATLPRALADIHVAVQSAQFPNYPIENPSKGWTYAEVDAQGTRNLARACVRAGVQRFIYLSCAGVTHEKGEPWFRAKRRAEEAVRESTLEFVVLRPCWVYGPEDRRLNTFLELTRYLPLVPVIGDGRLRVRPVAVDDVARVAALSISKPEAANRTFELAGPQELTVDEILQTVQTVIGKRRPLIHLPVGLVKLVAGFLSMLPSPLLSPLAIDFMLTREQVDPRPAQEFFGIQFEPFETALRRYLANHALRVGHV